MPRQNMRLRKLAELQPDTLKCDGAPASHKLSELDRECLTAWGAVLALIVLALLLIWA